MMKISLRRVRPNYFQTVELKHWMRLLANTTILTFTVPEAKPHKEDHRRVVVDVQESNVRVFLFQHHKHLKQFKRKIDFSGTVNLI